MLEGLSMYSDELMERLLLSEEPVAEALIHKIVRDAVQSPGLDPRVHGHGLPQQGRAAAARRDRPLFARRPWIARSKAKRYDDPTQDFPLEADPGKPFVGMAFKLVEDSFGQLTFMRIYQGTIRKGEMHFNQRTDQKQRFSRIVKMHADKREEIDSCRGGRHRGRAGRRLRQR